MRFICDIERDIAGDGDLLSKIQPYFQSNNDP